MSASWFKPHHDSPQTTTDDQHQLIPPPTIIDPRDCPQGKSKIQRLD
jgi:hypothetical protein